MCIRDSFHTELGDSPISFLPPYSGPNISRSHTADPEVKGRPRVSGISTPSVPIGLPATPRAMKHPQYMMGADTDPTAVATISGSRHDLSASPLRSSTPADDDRVGALLPSTTFNYRDPISRSASAPVERNTDGMPTHRAYKAALPPSHFRRHSRGHLRNHSLDEIPAPIQLSPIAVTVGIDETISESQVVIIEEEDAIDTILPELQHLASPPPPPPPPAYPAIQGNRVSLGVINIAIDSATTRISDPFTTLPGQVLSLIHI